MLSKDSPQIPIAMKMLFSAYGQHIQSSISILGHINISENGRDDEEVRRLFKYLKGNHVGTQSVDFYLQWAKMELDSGNFSKAKSVISNGLEALKGNSILLNNMAALETTQKVSFTSKIPIPLSPNLLLTPASTSNEVTDYSKKVMLVHYRQQQLVSVIVQHTA